MGPDPVRERDGGSLTGDGVRDFCHGQIAHYEIPRYVRFVDTSPMTVTGKIQKFLIRAQTIRELRLEAAETA